MFWLLQKDPCNSTITLIIVFLPAAGLAPETVTFDPALGMTVEKSSAQNKLRPEALESLYYMWRLTGERKYREWGWSIFQAFQKHCRGKTGYHSIKVRSFLCIPSTENCGECQCRKGELGALLLCWCSILWEPLNYVHD